VEGERLRLEPDLPAKLAFADKAFGERLQPVCDRYIAAAGIDAPPSEPLRQVAFEPEVLPEIDLAASGIGSVLWTSGYGRDWSWIEAPIFDDMGYPRHRRGVTEVPGLMFTGLLWQHNQLSATLPGAPLEAAHIARQLGVAVDEGDLPHDPWRPPLDA
jgi:putative flavoprotein involved in K+ transport